MARRIGKDDRLANQLWDSGVHEARILATLIAAPDKVTAREMDRWTRAFNAWDLVHSACCYLYAYARPAWRKAEAWSHRKEEFELQGPARARRDVPAILARHRTRIA